MKNKITTYKWAYLPFVFSSAAILATQATADPSGSQRYQDAKQVNSINHEYVGGDHSIGFGVDDEGNVDAEFDAAISRSDEHRTGVGLWAGYDLIGDNQGVLGRGGQVNHAWVSKDASGQVTRVNKTFAAYDRNEAGNDKATVGYGQENENLFWDGRVSKGLGGGTNARPDSNGNIVTDRAYDWGVGATVGKFLPDANARIRAGIDHEWSDKVGSDENDARNTTLSAGIEKFFQGTGHSLSLDVAGSKTSGGARFDNDDTNVTGRLGYKYNFGGSSIYQPDRRYRRVRVEVPGKAVAPRYAQKQQLPYKQLVKSTVELEGQTFFKLNSYKLIPSAQTRLKQIAAQIRKTGYKGSIRITGNTCGLGNAHYDQILSEKRAKEVKKFLIKNGFNPNHLIARGLGKGHPKYDRTPDQDFKNRRVDIEYVTQQQVQKTVYKTENKRVQTVAPRVIWKTEAIPTSPAWIQRALNNNIEHNTTVNTYTTTFGNEAPIDDGEDDNVDAANDAVATPEDQPITIDVLSNDDADATLTGTLTQPANGSVSILNGQIVYTPNDGFSGVDTFTYEVTDPQGNLTTAEVTVTVEGVIKAADDTATTAVGNAVTINVLDNDDSDATLTGVLTQPTNGSAVIVNGQIVYTPDAGFVGEDTFTYQVTDPEGNLATATVTVTVNDDDVKAAPDASTTNESEAVTINVLGNDDTDATLTGVLTQPTNGSAVIVNGQIVYAPDEDFVGEDTFTYQVTDPNGNLATATVTVTVTAAQNTVPVAVDDSITTDQGQSVKLDVLANDSDEDGDTLTITNIGPVENGTAVVVGNQIMYTPNADFVGTEIFTYTIADGNGGTTQGTVTVTVTAAPNKAPHANNDNATTGQGQSVKLDTLANDSDPDGDPLTITNIGPVANGIAVIVGNQIMYTPNADFVGTETFTYTISDGNGGTAQATETVVVTAAPNKAPHANNDSVTAMCSAITIDVLGNDTDPDGDSLSIVSVDAGSLKFGTVQQAGNQITYRPSRACSKGKTGTDNFSYTISDGNGNTDSANVQVIVEASGGYTKADANTDDALIKAGQEITLDVLANDKGHGLQITYVSHPKYGYAKVIDNKVFYKPKAGWTGSDMFSYDIVDKYGNKDWALIIIDVLKNH